MSDDLDDRLRDALRPEDPGEQFLQGVLARIESESAAQRRRAMVRLRWAAAVASLAIGALAVYGWQVRRAAGLEARRQLIEALQLTGEKLDLAYRVVNGHAQPDPGA